MNIKKFLDAMGELDDRYIEEALFYKKQRKKFGWMKCVTAAACCAAGQLSAAAGRSFCGDCFSVCRKGRLY